MNSPVPHLISVEIRVNDSGWFVATSPDCPGLFWADPSRERVVDLIAEGIEVLYQVRDKIDVKAIRLTRPVETGGAAEAVLSFAAIPAESFRLNQTV